MENLTLPAAYNEKFNSTGGLKWKIQLHRWFIMENFTFILDTQKEC